MAKSLTIGDLLFRLGYSNADEFVEALDKTLKKGESEAKKGGRKAGKGFSDQFKATFGGAALGSFLGATFSQMFTRASAAIQQFAKQSIEDYATYEQGLVQLKLAGETNLGPLQDRIKALSKETRVFSSIDVSQAVGQLVKAGFDVDTAFELVSTGALGAASEVDAATGKFGNLGDTSVALGGILRALQLDVNQSGRVMDVLARSAQDSNLDVSDLVDIIGKVGPVANLAGLEIEDLAAMAGVLANAGMDAGSMGTSLRAVLQTLINPAEGVKQQLDALGISLITSTGEMRDFDEVLAGLADLIDQGPQGLELLTQAFGAFGGGAAANLGSLSEELTEFRRNMDDAEGSAKELADQVRDTGHGAMAEMEAQMASARVELGEQLMPVMIEMHQDVLPPLVTGLGHAITFFQALKFAVTGIDSQISRINDELARSTQESRETVDAERGEGWFDAKQRELALIRAISEVQERLDGDGWAYNTLGGRRRDEERLALLNAELSETQELIGEITEARADLDEALAMLAVSGAPDPPPVVAPDAAAIAAVAEAYRNLAAIEAELAEAKRQRDTAATAEAEEEADRRVKILEAEVKAKKAVLETASRSPGASTTTRTPTARIEDPLSDEAQRVRTDLTRLKLLYEQGDLDLDEYVSAQEAHLRRLDGLYEQRSTPAQTLAILQARKVFLDELERLDAIHLSSQEKFTAELLALEAAQHGYYADEAAAESAGKTAAHEARQQAKADARIRNNQRTVDELMNLESAYHAWLEQEETDRVAKQESILQELLSIEGAHLDYLVEQDIEARQRATTKARELEEAKAAARVRNNQRMVDELIQIEQSYYDYLAQEEAAAEERDRVRAQAKVDAAERHGQRVLDQLLELEGAYHSWLESSPFEAALGASVRLAKAQEALGQATQDDVVRALEAQLAAIDALLPTISNLDDRYYELANAAAAARLELARYGDAEYRESLRAEQDRISDIIEGEGRLTEAKRLALLERLQMELDALDASVTANLAAIDAIEAAMKRLGRQRGVDFVDPEEQLAQFEERMYGIVMGFPTALAAGIMDGDIAGALQSALGSATDFFMESMLQAILGPIAEQLTASIVASVAAGSAAQAGAGAASGAAGAAAGASALGPWGLLIGAGLFLATSLVNSSQRRSQQQEQRQSSVDRTVSGAGAITYNLTANVTVENAGSWSDPAFYSRWRSETESLVTSLLGKVRKD